MKRFDHVSILASAGSGKTYRLTTRFLQLLAAGAPASTILATTFTRAAAGEIRDRILERLAKACLSADGHALLERDLGFALPPGRGLDMLREVTRELHRLQVRTIDSFFAGIVRCFAPQMDLPAEATIAQGDAARLLRHEAISRLLEVDDRASAELVTLLRELIEGRTTRPVVREIETLVTAMEGVRSEAPAEAWSAIEPWPVMSETQRASAIDALADAAARCTMADGRMARAAEQDIACLRACRESLADDWNDFLDTGLARKIATEEAPSYYKKPISASLVGAYAPLIAHARGVIRNSLVTRTRRTRDLLERYDHAYREARRSMRAITFADLTAAVADRQRHWDLDDLYFRLDGRVHHLLLDEMQDTSVAQWRALLPLAEEILANEPVERTFFCVGDVKQSIYGWRDAAPELLEALPERFEHVETERLDHSWRSSPVVIDVVNRVFSAIPGNPALDRYPEAADAWDAGFTRHHVVERNKGLPGRVELRSAPTTPDGDDARATRLRAGAELVRDLHAAAPSLTIGVLTRTNPAAARILNELSRLGVRATGRGGGVLTDAPPVQVVLDALRLADHPDHTIAAFNLLHSPLGAFLASTREAAAGAMDSEASETPIHARHDLSHRIRHLVQTDGLAVTITSWIEAIAPACDSRELSRLWEVVELAETFDEHPSLRLDDFIRQVEAADVADTVASGVEVMTIHKSKGLEFDLVILPDLDDQLVRTGREEVVADRPEAGSDIDAICRGCAESMWSQFDDMSAMFRRLHNRLARESLCVLYVAMTRAVHGLSLLVDPPRPRLSASSHACLLRHALAPDLDAKQWPADAILFEHGSDRDWLTRANAAREAKECPTPQQADAYDGAAAPVRLKRSRSARIAIAPSPSGLSASSPGTLRLPDSEALDVGTALHALLERVGWLEDGVPDDAALGTMLQTVLPRRSRSWHETQLASFHRVLGLPEVARILSRRGRAAETLALWPERRFARDAGGGAMQQGAIDRLEAEFDSRGRCVRACIIDYKTNPLLPEECEARLDHYRPQLAAYRAAASEWLEIPQESIGAVLVFTSPGVVMEWT